MDKSVDQLITHFKSVAEIKELSANQPELLNAGSKLWLVETGSVDLFLVETANDYQTGARHPLFRINPGQLLVPIYGLQDSWQILAAGIPNTRVLTLNWDDITLTEEVISVLSKWQQKTLKSLLAETPSGMSVELEQTGSQTIKANQTLRYTDDFSKIKLHEGNAIFMGLTELALPIQELPLVRGCWLNTTTDCTMELVEHDSGCNGEQLQKLFNHYHQFISARYLQLIQHQTEIEKQRINNKNNQDKQLLHNSLTDMLTILEDKDQLKVVPPGQSVLIAVCGMIAKELNIELKQPNQNLDLKIKEQVQEIARVSKFRLRDVVLTGKWWITDNGPLLAFFEENEAPVALYIRHSHYVLKNPATGQETKVDEALAETLSPIAYSFYRSLPNHPLSSGDMYRFARYGLGSDIWMVLLMGMVGGLLGMLPPIAMGMLIDTIIPGADRIQLAQLTFALIAFGMGNALFSITRAFAMVRVESRMDGSLQAAVWDRILSLPVPFFRDYNAGDLASRAMGINTIRQILSGTTTATLIASIFSLFNLAMMFYYSFDLALMGCLVVLIGAIITLVVGYYNLQYQREITSIQGKLAGTVLQLIKAIPKIQGSGSERRAYGQWSERFVEQRRLTFKARKAESIVATSNAVIPLISAVCIFSVVMFMVDPTTASLTTGQFLAFNAAFGVFMSSVLQTASTMIQVLNIIPIYERAKPILQAIPEIDERKADPGQLYGDLEVNQATFRYHEDGPDILKNISIKANPGEFIALVGSSGSGKSTLLRLLLGFEQLTSGSIYYDAKNLADLDLHSVRRQIGVVLQSGKLTVGEIYTNIVGARALTIKDAWNAAKMAGLEQDIKDMPMGMHTLVSEGSGTLSGGQRQRLLIARALVNRPKIIYFDEATSALDNPTQAQVSESLDNMQATRIVIAHRLSTIINADRIYVMEAGQVVEEGNYESLMQLNGHFAEMAKRQLA